MSTIDELADTFKLLADPTRLRLVRLLAGDKQLCVNALARKLGVTQSAVSQHLRLLRQADLVTSLRQGSFMHYSLKPRKLSALQATLRDLLGGADDASG